MEKVGKIFGLNTDKIPDKILYTDTKPLLWTWALLTQSTQAEDSTKELT